jgi:tocopherol cyclase
MWNLRTQLHPEMYHGINQNPPFFEGWYYKLISVDEQARYALVIGVILGNQGHAFIQVLNGSTGKSTYHTFPLEQFWTSSKEFEVHIGKSRFTREQVSLDVDDELGKVSGNLRFEGGVGWPVSLLSPGIMGWYAWVPNMECYHGVLSFNHTIKGVLSIDNQTVDFSQGNGYIEKDWGQSFPSAWIWFQSNHFDQPDTCITASIATIPWMGRAFKGFIVGFWHKNRLYRFATYSRARIEQLVLSSRQVDWVLRSGKYRLELHATRAQGGLLLGPTRVEMGKRVDETLLSTVDVRLTTTRGETIFMGQGRNAGLEVFGELK